MGEKKVEALTACGFATEDEETREEITAIGLAHSMVTPYTSFVAVLDEVRNPEGKAWMWISRRLCLRECPDMP